MTFGFWRVRDEGFYYRWTAEVGLGYRTGIAFTRDGAERRARRALSKLRRGR